jgi:hypothetical protein
MARGGTLKRLRLQHGADRFSCAGGIGDSGSVGLCSASDADGTGASDAGSVA